MWNSASSKVNPTNSTRSKTASGILQGTGQRHWKTSHFPGSFQRNKLLPGGPRGPGGPCTDSPDDKRNRGIIEYLVSKLHSPETWRMLASPCLHTELCYITYLVVQGDLVVLLALVNLPALCKWNTHKKRENCCYRATATMETLSLRCC